jgi:hypothetical protein
LTYTHQGKTGDVLGIASQLEEISIRRRVSPLALGFTQAALGNSEAAGKLLEDALEDRDIWLVSFLRQPFAQPFFPHSLRESFLRRMNLP